MAIPVIIYGRSGSGKSTSLEHLDDALILNVCAKREPYPKNPTQLVINQDPSGRSLDYDFIKKSILAAATGNNKDKKRYTKIVIDDAWQLIGADYMNRVTNLSGNAVFDSYNKLAKNCYELYQFIINGIPNSEDVVVYLLSIEDLNDQGYRQPYRIGKVLEGKTPIESYCTIVLRTTKENGKYWFKTSTDNYDVCKTPKGMFNDINIPNDLDAVDKRIREYWEIK